ncbi:GtrA family protein [Telmatospirillum siberiense]|nr:GtrA family protein [Telmatospirillum siberiense]
MTVLGKFLRYSWVALMSAGSDWLVFSALVSLVGLAHLPALMTARVIGGLVSFLVNRHWTWSTKRRTAVTREGRRFLVLYAGSYALAVGLFSLLVDGLGIGPYPGKLATDICCFLMNFLVMNAYVFHRRQGFSRFLQRKRDRLTSEISR